MNKLKLSQEGALSGLLSLLGPSGSQYQSNNEGSDDLMMGGEKNTSKQRSANASLERSAGTFLLCGGLEKKFIFQQAILPVLKTICGQMGCEVREFVAQLVMIMFNSTQQQTSHQQNEVNIIGGQGEQAFQQHIH